MRISAAYTGTHWAGTAINGRGDFSKACSRRNIPDKYVSAERRELRERNFNSGKLPILFCSPTMELGVDIKDLSVVHMRNVPPTPANYAQRSGRAGRGGKAALVLAFASHGNVHDRYFFRKSRDMIAGVVAPPRIDIVNQELVEAHLQSTWLSILQPRLGQSISEVLDLDQPDFPIRPEIAEQLKPSEQKVNEITAAFHDVISSGGPELAGAHWYSQPWLDDIARSAPQRLEGRVHALARALQGGDRAAQCRAQDHRQSARHTQRA